MMNLETFKAEYDKNIIEHMVQAFEGVPQPHLSYVKMSAKHMASFDLAAWSSFKTMSQWHDGEELPLDEAMKRWSKTVTMLFFGLGFEVSRNHYGYGDASMILEWASTLGDSAATAVAVAAAALLNNAFATALDDGSYLCASDHPTAGSTQSNLVGAAALSPTTIDTAITYALQTVDFRGKPTPQQLVRLIVPPALRKIAQECNGSPLVPYKMDNQINVDQGQFEIVVDHNLTSSTAYFFQGPKHKLEGFVGEPIGPKAPYDIDATESRVYGIKGDFVFAANDWTGIVGCAGA